jgi:LacI family transcriptional regulator
MSDRVTMADVAREAGVSSMTVSRVINNKGHVSPETRARVREAIERLGYRPSGIARSLATRRTGTLGLVVPDVANPFFADVARGVEQVAYQAGYNVFLCNTEEDPQRERAVLASLEEKRVDGVVLCSSRLEDDLLAEAVTAHPAAVLVNRRLDPQPAGVGTVVVDDVTGATLVTRHLLKAGHRAIGFLTGPPISRSGRRRVRGFRDTLAAWELTPDPDLMPACAPTVAGGRAEALALLRAHPELTALLGYNDLVAVGVLQACAELGRDVPDGIAVAGFDDIPLAALVSPPLTTCHIPRDDLGARAMRRLLAQIAGEAEDSQEIVVQPELVIRASAPKTR